MRKTNLRKDEKDVLTLLNELNLKMDALMLNQKTLERRVGYLKGELLFSLREEIVGESDIYPNYYVDR